MPSDLRIRASPFAALTFMGFSSSSATRDVGGDGEPRTVTARPHVRVTAGSRLTVGPRVGRRRVDYRDVPDDADLDVHRLEIRDPDRPRRLLQEGVPIDERAVGI